MKTRFLLDNAELNLSIRTAFTRWNQDPDIQRTHLFGGRYENIYLNETHIPELGILIDEVLDRASTLLGNGDIRAGYWFNHMPPGSTTTRHSHDDGFELLSAVYYVTVPHDSGDLILYGDGTENRITPEEGLLLFFQPDQDHEVTVNNSSSERLSIGINIGPVHEDG